MKVPASFRSLSVIILSFFFFLTRIPNSVFANNYVFNDEFNTLTDKWNIVNNSGSVNLNNGYLTLSSSPSNHFPYVFLQNIVFPQNHYSIETKFQFTGSFNYGNGLIFSDKLLDNGKKEELLATDVIFQVWPWVNNTIGVWSTLCPKNDSNCVNGTYNLIQSYPIGTEITLKISDENNHYIVSSNGYIYETRDDSRKISSFWVGNPELLNSSPNWLTILIDYFRISIISYDQKSPIIIIPGFGGSWDMPALLTGTQGTNWTIPDYVKIYDGIFNSLKNAGYKENEDLFIFPYDWRKNIDSIADDLNNFIETHNLSDKQIDLVGHSMGGLVARTYAQKYPNSKINKIVTAGTPNNGTVDAYGLWEGATFWGNIWWEKTLVALTTELNRNYTETKIDTLRRIAPSVKDILPTNDFLFTLGILKPWTSLNQKNLFLDNLNKDSSEIASKIFPVWSSEEDTRSQLKTKNRSFYDGIMGLWEDGKPLDNNNFVYEKGDGTITESSAKGIYSQNAVQGSGNHIGLISTEDNIKKILDILGIDSSNLVSSYQIYPSNSFVAVLRSPGKLEVCNELGKCNTEIGLYYPEYKLFFLPGYTGENLRINIYEDGYGKYTLHTGKIDEESEWDSMIGNLQKDNQIDSYVYSDGKIEPTDKNQCKDKNWQFFIHKGFKNQGQCVSFVEEYLNRIKKHHLFEFDNKWLSKRFPHRR